MKTDERLGNTLVYLADRVENLSKTKLLKLLYLLDLSSIKRYGIPFLNLEYEVWKFGHVARELYIDLSEGGGTRGLSEYISNKSCSDGEIYIIAKKEFCDDEFSQNDMDILHAVTDHFSMHSAGDLVDILHDKESLWYKVSQKNGLLDDFLSGRCNSSTCKIDFEELFREGDQRLSIYREYRGVQAFLCSLAPQ